MVRGAVEYSIPPGICSLCIAFIQQCAGNAGIVDCHILSSQLGPKNSKSNEGRQAKNGGVKGRDGVQSSLTERMVRSRLQWAGHVERMADDRLLKRAAELREEGRRRLGRPRLRWEDCVKRDVKKTGDIGGWKRLADEAVKKLQVAPQP